MQRIKCHIVCHNLSKKKKKKKNQKNPTGTDAIGYIERKTNNFPLKNVPTGDYDSVFF